MSMRLASGAWPQTFKEAYCEKFHCRDADYERAVFRPCLYRHALPLANLILSKKPSFFQEDFDLIREIGNIDNADKFRSEINFFYGRNLRDKNRLRRLLRIRLSAKRLLKLKNEVLRNPIFAAVLQR